MPKSAGREKKLVVYGQTLQKARLSSGILNQKQAASRLTDGGLQCSQPLIAQHETGRIVDPSLNFLKAIAALYEVDYRDLVAVLVMDKYGVDFTSGEKPRNLLIQLVEKNLEELQKELARLKK
ncbi:MAG: helix-turn-helix transcriptional regulator [bacterium]|nr:helix-turn-helix transcriptional regulator [bacterium]